MLYLGRFVIIMLTIISSFSCKKIFDPVGSLPKIAYRSAGNIFIMDIDGGNKVNITNDRYKRILNARFFPKGDKIVFDYYNVETTNFRAIGVIDLDGNMIFESENLGGFYYYRNYWNPFASPDGSYIAFLVGDANLPGPIFAVNIKKNIVFELVPYNENYWHLQFTPHGNSIIYGNYALWSVNVTDTSKYMISDTAGIFHKYTPDGSKIVFQKNEHYYWEPLCIMDSNGENFKELADNFDPRFEYDISSDGAKIAYTGEPYGIYIINIDGTNQTCITDTLGGWDPSFSPDNKKIVFTAYISNDHRVPEIYIMDVDGKNRKILTLDDGYASEFPISQPMNY